MPLRPRERIGAWLGAARRAVSEGLSFRRLERTLREGGLPAVRRDLAEIFGRELRRETARRTPMPDIRRVPPSEKFVPTIYPHQATKWHYVARGTLRNVVTGQEVETHRSLSSSRILRGDTVGTQIDRNLKDSFGPEWEFELIDIEVVYTRE